MAGLLSVSYYLVSLFFSLILFVSWMRFVLRYFRVSHLHPMASAIYQLTDPLFLRFDRLVYQRYLPRYDGVTFAGIVLLEVIKFLILGLIVYHRVLPVSYLTLLTLGSLITLPCDLLFYAILIRMLLSWVNPIWQQHPLAELLIRITEPSIRFGHKILPNISGFDFSPMVMLIILKVITMFITASMPVPLL